jgi:trk system potassium uptake protein TrkH
MRNRLAYLKPVLQYLAALCWVFGFVLLLPALFHTPLVYLGAGGCPVSAFLLPTALAWTVGGVFRGGWHLERLDSSRAMLVCALGWVLLSALGALPFVIGLRMPFTDAFFESVSGFTTTGFTLFSDPSALPPPLLFWRSLMQWLGGLGILTFFLGITFASGAAPHLSTAESQQLAGRRPVPSLFGTLRIMWGIYTVLTLVWVGLLAVLGLPLFEAVLHGMTTIATGGFSSHGTSIAHFSGPEYAHPRAIQYVIITGMLLGGTSFVVHYRLLCGQVRALWDTLEVRLYALFLVAFTGVLMLDHLLHAGPDSGETLFRTSLFHVTSLLTSAGFTTHELGSGYFPVASRYVFLVLMVVGGCSGSTSGGFKLIRIGTLWRMVGREVRRLIHGRSVVSLVVVDGRKVEDEDVSRTAALFFAWLVLIAAGAVLLALRADLEPMAALSAMVSAVGNMGPSTMPFDALIELGTGPRFCLILGMLAGRLEVLPRLLLLNRRAWG